MMSEPVVQQVAFEGANLWVLRDDLVADGSVPAFSGNKARKLYYYLHRDFPDIRSLISYGSPQSNMLYSLSVLAQIKGWQLLFYVDHIAEHLRASPRGNYAAALEAGAQIIEVAEGVSSVEEYVQDSILPNTDSQKVLYIPEGGRSAHSELGFSLLAQQIVDWARANGLSNPKLMLPSGTGTSALFLQKNLPFEVLTCACVGSVDYLQKQFSVLSANNRDHPTILPSPQPDGRAKKYHFGKLYPEFYRLWQHLKDETGIRFELLYDPLGWLCMMAYLQAQKSQQAAQLIYLHQGGLLGNDTMIARYRRMLAKD